MYRQSCYYHIHSVCVESHVITTYMLYAWKAMLSPHTCHACRQPCCHHIYAVCVESHVITTYMLSMQAIFTERLLEGISYGHDTVSIELSILWSFGLGLCCLGRLLSVMCSIGVTETAGFIPHLLFLHLLLNQSSLDSCFGFFFLLPSASLFLLALTACDFLLFYILVVQQYTSALS